MQHLRQQQVDSVEMTEAVLQYSCEQLNYFGSIFSSIVLGEWHFLQITCCFSSSRIYLSLAIPFTIFCDVSKDFVVFAT
jgi:hypothetical protein